jgi:hypothetical protein
MPACEGLPNGPCPKHRNDKFVTLGKGDLLLCPDCDNERRRLFDDAKKPKSTRSSALRSGSSSTAAPVAHTDKTSVDMPAVVAAITSAPIAAAAAADTVSDTAAANTDSRPNLIVNELLCYISFFRNKSNADSLRRTVLSFYVPTDISEAKKKLCQTFHTSLNSCPLLAERRSSSTRAAHEAETDDIVGILDALDMQGSLVGVSFVAANLDALPKFGPEEINVAAVVDRQVRVETAIQEISTTVQQLASNQLAAGSTALDSEPTHHAVKSMVADMQLKFDAFAVSVNARLDHLSTVCNKSISSLNHQNNSVKIDDDDRKSNIVLFGLKEDRDASKWRHDVDNVLHYIVDHSVDVVDTFRLGRYASGKTRPVLVKLRSGWDKRLILSKCNKLKQYTQRGIFIAPDEPLEVRRKQTFDRLQYRAEHAGKCVDVVNGILYVEGVAEYSLVDGSLNSQHG